MCMMDKRRAGFSLIEISLALLVVSIGMLAIAGLFPTSLGMGKRAIDETYASFLADSAFSSYKGAAVYYSTNFSDLVYYTPIAPNTVNDNEDVFWENSESLRLVANGGIRTLNYRATSSNNKWEGGSYILPNGWSMDDHALRYRITMTQDNNDQRIMKVQMEIWMGEFGSSDSKEAEVFYTEIFNHGG